MSAPSNPRIFLSAGEASGDHYGAQIIAELRRRHPSASFTGLGGVAMASAGQQRVVRAEDVAHMGITEVVRQAPNVFRQYRRLVRSIRSARPDAAVLIDFPDVNFRLARHLKQLGVPVVWFVSPQLWAWKRRRLRWVQERVDRMLVIFPFEEPFYRARGVAATFVGHPLASGGVTPVTRADYALRYHLNPDSRWVALLPGSRLSELRNNLQPMVDGATLLYLYPDRQQPEFLVPVAPGISDAQSDEFRRSTETRLKSARTPPKITFVRDTPACLAHARAAVVASGTATVQALVAGTPFLTVYRVSRLTFALAKRLVRYPEEIAAALDEAGNLPVAMPNLIAGRRIVPELLNERFTGEAVAAALRPLLEEGPTRQQMIADLAATRELLVVPGGAEPIVQVCHSVDELLTPAAATPRTAGATV